MYSSSLLQPGRRLAALLACCGVLLLSGCATTTVAVDPLKLTAVSKETPVAVSITANTGEVNGFSSLTLRRVQPPVKPGESAPPAENFVMNLVAPGLARDTSLFIGALPPGEYQFVELNDHVKRKVLRMWSGTPLLGTFKVEAGKPTDLGRMIVTPVNLHVVFGRSVIVKSNAALMQRFAPEYAKLFGTDASGGWTAGRKEIDRVEEYARQRPVGADCASEMADGSVAVASRLGTVLMRSQQGRWRALRAPGLESVLCVLPVDLPNAELVAVGEFGTLLRKARGSDQLLPVDVGNLPPGNLIHLAGNAKLGWYLVHQKGNDVTLFYSRQLEGGDWQAQRKENVALSLWNGQNLIWAWHDEQGTGYALSSGVMHRLDYASGAWSQASTPESARLLAYRRTQGGTIGILTSPGGGMGGVFAGVYYSRDEGKSWAGVQAPFNVKVSPVLQLKDGRMVMPGGVFSKTELQISSDDGKTWSHQGDYELGRTLVPLSTGDALDMDSGQHGLFTIRSSVDAGKTWRVEYSNFDKEAYDAQQKKK